MRRFFGRCFQHFTNLNELDIAGCILDAAIMLEFVPFVKELNYQSHKEGETRLDRLEGMHLLPIALHRLDVLEVLDIYGKRSVFGTFFLAIARDMPRLKKLILSDYIQYDPTGLRMALTESLSLRSVSFRCCELGALDNFALADALTNRRLTSLKGGDISDAKNATLICQSLATNSILVELELKVRLADRRIYVALVLAMRENRTLKKLTLSRDYHYSDGEADAVHSAGLQDILLVSLRSNRSLERLNFSNSHLDGPPRWSDGLMPFLQLAFIEGL